MSTIKTWEQRHTENPSRSIRDHKMDEIAELRAAALRKAGSVNDDYGFQIALDDYVNAEISHRKEVGTWDDAHRAYKALVNYLDLPAAATPQDTLKNADSERIDFIDAKSLHVQTCYAEGSQEPVYEICIVHGAIEDDSLQCIGSGATLREAIDGAIESERASMATKEAK